MNLPLNMNKYLRSGQIKKLKTLKLWAQQNLPTPLRPMIDYTLGWLSPDLLGTGFSAIQQTDSMVIAEVPFRSLNKDFQNQIHMGLVINAGLEMIKIFSARHFVGHGYQFLKTNLNLNKKLDWTADLNLKMNIDLEIFERKIIEFQKNKKAEFEFEIEIHVGDSKKTDSLNYKIAIEKINLLS